MVRIGRQIPHFAQVRQAGLEAVFSPCRTFRYLLSIPFESGLYDEKRNRVMTVILKNPSSADLRAADATIRKVETFVYHRFSDVSVLHILNLFALRATDAADLNRVYRESGPEAVIGPENDNYIANFARNSDYLITAWGNRSGIDEDLYTERVLRVINRISELPSHRVLQVKGKNPTVQPLHGLMWGYDYEVLPFFDLKRG
ncbi:MAG: DUF1643 domain-containing protein [Bacteroidota bacterium]